jgi:hypothetical protein
VESKLITWLERREVDSSMLTCYKQLNQITMKTQIVLFFVLLIAAMACDKAASTKEEIPDSELLLSPFFGYTYTEGCCTTGDINR